MRLKSLESQLATLSKVDEAFAACVRARETLLSALAELSDSGRTGTVAELIADAAAWLSQLEAEITPDDATPLPQVAEAICGYLREHPDSTTREIYAAVRGRFRTDSTDPNRLTRVTLSQMKKRGEVTADERNRYRLAGA